MAEVETPQELDLELVRRAQRGESAAFDVLVRKHQHRVVSLVGRYIADWLKVTPEEARVVQKQYWRDHGTSMRGMMTLHGVDPKHYLDYVHDIDYSPVPHAPDLEASLAKLPGRKLIFTAGDVPHAERYGAEGATYWVARLNS